MLTRYSVVVVVVVCMKDVFPSDVDCTEDKSKMVKTSLLF